jgi:hypothetical protein
MSEPIYNTVVKETINELVKPYKEVSSLGKSLLDAYFLDLVAEGQLLIKSGTNEKEVKEYLSSEFNEKMFDIVAQSLINSSEYKDELYQKSYERLKTLGDNNTTYGDLLGEIYEGEYHLSEIFVRIVEETEGVLITSAKQLQELTGVEEIYGYWDHKKGETVPYGDKTPTKKEAQEIATKELKGIFTEAMFYRYRKALDSIIEAGGKYQDLLKVKPSYFNLPEKWETVISKDQYTTILYALDEAFLIGEVNSSIKPDLRSIAKEIEAPYSVLMDAHKLCNRWKL